MFQLQRTIRSPYLHAAAAIFFASCMNAMIKGLSAHESVVVVTAWRYSLGACLALILWTIFRPKLPGWGAVPFHLLRGFFQIMSAGLFLLGRVGHTASDRRSAWPHRHTDGWTARMATA